MSDSANKREENLFFSSAQAKGYSPTLYPVTAVRLCRRSVSNLSNEMTHRVTDAV